MVRREIPCYEFSHRTPCLYVVQGYFSIIFGTRVRRLLLPGIHLDKWERNAHSRQRSEDYFSDMSEAIVTPELIRAALTTVKYPGFSRDIVSFGLVKNIEVSAAGAVRIELRIESKNEDVPRFVYQSVMTEVKEMPGVKSIDVDIEYHNPDVEKKASVQDDPAQWKTTLPGVKHIIGISSGKGGVGKSTVLLQRL